jgi:hypothetical protein
MQLDAQCMLKPCGDAGTLTPARDTTRCLLDVWNGNTNRQLPGRTRPDPAAFSISGAWRLNLAALNMHNVLGRHDRKGNPKRGSGHTRLGCTRGDPSRATDNSPVSLVASGGQGDFEADREELGNGSYS